MPDKTLLVCMGTGCVSAGSYEIFSALSSEISKNNLDGSVAVKQVGCHGFCQRGPLVVLKPEEKLYCGVTIDDVPEIVNSCLPGEKGVDRLYYKDPVTGKPVTHYCDIPFYKKQIRTVLKYCGHIDPENIEEYLETGGYQGLRKALKEMSSEEIIDEVKKSGLRGLGGAGFPTFRKWETAYKAKGDSKYIICNADEGDPGAFQDRSVLEGNPHLVIEGMAIAGYVIGANKGYIYVRAEYPLAVKRLNIALFQAREKGFLGKQILGSSFNFDIEIFQGAGAFVCGEETALIASIEGDRGMPRTRPPYPAVSGLWGHPTCLNNVKTLANISLIIVNGSGWFSSVGTEKSKGTAIFSLTGKTANCGLIEVPMGITLREIIEEIGGGIPGGKAFKAVQTGGPSGGCLPERLLDTAVDFDSLTAAGSIMGSGGMVVMDEDTCMVDVARYFLDFTQKESCGKCIPCRLGTKEMLTILEDLTNGLGKEEDIDLLVELAESIKKGSLCGLGQTAPNPVLTTIRYFREEYEAHIREKKCPAKACKALIAYKINEEKCKACMICLKKCPVSAISGALKQVHKINQDDCIKCGICLEVCPARFGAVECLSGNRDLAPTTVYDITERI